MSTLTTSIHVDMPAAALFTFLTTLWENGAALGDTAAGAAISPAARMGDGFRLPCSGSAWAIAGDVELEVGEYCEPEGWRAAAYPDARFVWTVRVTPVGPGALLRCAVRYRPRGVQAWLHEWLGGRRRRARALRRLLAAWRAGAERHHALGRLRAALDARGAAPPRGDS